MLKDVAQIIGKIEAGSGAGGVDRAQNIDDGAAESGFAELRAGEKAFFNAQRPLRAVIGKFQKWIVEIQRQFGIVIDDVLGRPIKLGSWRPDIWCKVIIAFEGVAARTCAGSGGNAAVAQSLPNFPAVSVSQAQHIRCRASFGVDQFFHARERQKPSEHKVAKKLIVFAIAPERAPGMRSAPSKLHFKFIAQNFARQIRRGKIALENQRTRLRAPRLQEACEQIADTALMRAKKSDRAARLKFLSATNQKTHVECLFITRAVSLWPRPAEMFVIQPRKRVFIALAFINNFRFRIVAPQNPSISIYGGG